MCSRAERKRRRRAARLRVVLDTPRALVLALATPGGPIRGSLPIESFRTQGVLGLPWRLS